jgi:hypothetical protein
MITSIADMETLQGPDRLFDKKEPRSDETSSTQESPNPERGDDNNLLDWDGETDPSNPKNWSFGKKAFHTALPASLTFVM